MNNFFVIDWDDGSSDCYRKDELVVDGITGRVLKQFKNEMCMGKIASFHSKLNFSICMHLSYIEFIYINIYFKMSF